MTNYLVLVVFCLSLLGANVFQYKSHEAYVTKTSGTIASLKATNRNLNSQILKLEEDKREFQQDSLELSRQKVDLEKQLFEKNRALKKYEDTSIINANTQYIQERANSASKLKSLEIACKTGSSKSCADYEAFKLERAKTKKDIFQ